jgi:hypothetical protein
MGRLLHGVLFFMLACGLPGQLFAYNDQDLDGVEDGKDRCPDSSMEDFVDETGCVPKTGFTLAVGAGSSSGDYGTTETIESSTKDIQLSYSKDGWYASAATSYLESGIDDPALGTEEQSGMGDTYVGLGYTAFNEKWSLGVQGVLKLPTAEDDIGTGNSDIGAYVTMARMDAAATLFVTGGYLITGDDAAVSYNDITSLSVGAGKSFGEHLFASVSAARSDALVDGMDPSQSLSLFAGYQLDLCWYLNASYTKGLSDSVADNAFSVMVGYTF